MSSAHLPNGALEFGNLLGNSKKNFGILEFPRKFQNSKIPKFFGRCFGIQEKILEFWNFLGNSKKNFGILEFPGKFQKKTLEFWNSLGNSKIPKFQSFLEDVLEFKKKYWNFGIS